jgi:hypothetical protein
LDLVPSRSELDVHRDRLIAVEAGVGRFVAKAPDVLHAAGIGCIVAAAGEIERPAQSLIATTSAMPSACCGC